MRKPRYIYEILYRDEDGKSGSRNIPANSEEEATEMFFEGHPDADITDINERENQPEYEKYELPTPSIDGGN